MTSSLDTMASLSCATKAPYAYCLPEDYNKDVGPWHAGKSKTLSLPWIYFFEFFIFDIHEVNDQTQTVTLEMYSKIKWYDPRVVINANSSEWKDQVLQLDGDDYFSIPLSQMDKFWFPHLEILGLKSYTPQRVKNMLTEAFKINSNSLLRHIDRVEVVISCKMDFEKYPFDSQFCVFQQGSFYHPKGIVDCNASFDRDEHQHPIQYMIEILHLPAEYDTVGNNGQEWASCGFKMEFKRKKMAIFCQTYLPSIILVALTCVSFIVPPEVVPGRIGLLVTVLLMLINIYIGVKANAPKSSGSISTMDIFFIVCFGQVFVAFMEYGVVLFLRMRRKNILIEIEGGGENSLIPTKNMAQTSTRSATNSWISDETGTGSTNQHPNPNTIEGKYKTLMTKSDNVFLICYPISFLIFTTLYFFIVLA